MSIADNLAQVREAIAQAAVRAGRSPDEIALMAVSKTHPPEAVREAYDAGQRLFGENRVQEAAAKRTALADLAGVVTHLIGPLQSNKAARAVESLDAVETVDSARLAHRLERHCVDLNRRLTVFIEVKLSDEPSKHGCPPDDLETVLEAVAASPHLDLRGLMTVPAYTENPDLARPAFAQLRALRDHYLPGYPALTGLSMGMSHDFAAAIQEGSTEVRVGTAIFGARPPR